MKSDINMYRDSTRYTKYYNLTPCILETPKWELSVNSEDQYEMSHNVAFHINIYANFSKIER